MKIKNYFLLLALGLCLSFSMTACSDDDDEVTTEDEQEQTDPEETTSVTSEVAGTYSGYVDVLFSYITNPYAYPEETLTITAADDTTVDVAYENETWGTYAISGATVTDNGDGTYSIEGTGTATMDNHQGGTNEYDADFTATIADGSSELVFSVPDVMTGTTVSFHEGDAPASYYAYGSYEGYTELESALVSLGAASQTVEVALNADDYSVVDITYESDYGTVTVSAATATDNGDGTYTLDMVEVGNFAINMSMNGYTINDDYEITSFTATISDDGSTFVFGMDFMSGTTVTFYEGDSPAAYIAQGDYEGALELSVSGASVGTVAETVTVSATGHEEATVSLSAFDITVAVMSMSISLGDMDIEGVAVSTDDNETCTFSASGVEFTVDYNGSEIGATADVSGSVTNGDEQSGEIEFTFTLGSMPFPITATFTVGATVEDDTDTDTDTETGTAGGATEIEGDYTGTLTLTTGADDGAATLGQIENQALTITATDETTAEITLSAFSIEFGDYGTFALDDIVVSDVTISTEDNETYTFYAEGISVPVTFSGMSMTVSGTLSGTIVKGDTTSGNLVFVLTVYGMEVTATFVI